MTRVKGLGTRRLRDWNTRNVKPWQWAVGLVVILCLIGALLGVAGRAVGTSDSLGAERVQSRSCTHTNLDDHCWFGIKGSVRKFRDGYFHRSHGFPARRVFRHPRAARSFFVNKLSARLGHISKQHRSRIAWHFFGNSRTGGCSSPTLCYGCSDYCLAWKMYGQLMAASDCVGYGRPTSAERTCTYGTHASVTKRGVQRGGALVICGTAVFIGILSAPETAGGGTVAAAGITGSVGCGWSFWSSFR